MTAQDQEYIPFIANRAFSGVVNGLFYAGAKTALAWALPVLFILTVAVCVIPLVRRWKGLSTWRRILSIVGTIGSSLAVVLLGVSFQKPTWKYADIHLYTLANQSGMAGTNFFSKVKWWTLALAVYPSVFLQKVFVNIIPGNSVWYSGTDTVSGKYYSLPLLGLKVPRFANMYVRLGLAALSIGAFLFLRRRK